MAKRGAKPKAAQLRLVDGTHRNTRHGPAPDLVTVTDGSPVECPLYLVGEARTAWQRWIAPCFWIDQHREAAAVVFCCLWAEFYSNPNQFPSARHGQMRAYMSELGLTDERQRGKRDDKSNDPAAKYL